MVEEFPDEEWLAEGAGERPDDSWPQPWHGLYFRAWDALRFDRQYGALGGETFIGYMALRKYAEAEGVEDWPIFHRFMIAIDDEWLQQLERRRTKKGTI